MRWFWCDCVLRLRNMVWRQRTLNTFLSLRCFYFARCVGWRMRRHRRSWRAVSRCLRTCRVSFVFVCAITSSLTAHTLSHVAIYTSPAIFSLRHTPPGTTPLVGFLSLRSSLVRGTPGWLAGRTNNRTHLSLPLHLCCPFAWCVTSKHSRTFIYCVPLA